MFKALHAVARHTPLHIIVTANGEQLRLIVTPKPSGDAANHKALAQPFVATGTPEELDAEFPAACEKYTTAVNDFRSSVDLPLDALQAEKGKAAKKEEAKAAKQKAKEEAEAKRKAAAEQAARTRAENKKKAEEEAERKRQERAAKRAAKKAGGIELPGQKPPAAEASAPATSPRAGLPGKEDCLRDYYNLKRVHGDKLKRRLFIKKADTGRRYEKLWKNWEAFVKEAEAQGELPLDTKDADAGKTEVTGIDTAREELVTTDARAVGNDGPGPNDDNESAAPQGKGEAVTSPATSTLESSATKADTAPAAAAPAKPAEPEKPFRVLDAGGKVLVQSRYTYNVGEKLTLPGQPFPFRVVRQDEANPQHFHAVKVLSAPNRVIDTATGKEIGTTETIYTIGDPVEGLPVEGNFRVHNTTLDAYHVRDARLTWFEVYSVDGTKLGEHAALEAPTIGDKVDAGAAAGLTVIAVDGKAITAVAVKPRQPVAA